MQPLNADTITDDQIEALRIEAREHDDALQVAYCNVALGITPMIALTATRYGARIQCADAINNARAAI